ncbi:MAG TPA: hypothetical protein VMR33_00110 [Candidatus Baltobacteraceae bacterium]|nr:hypothetical protein [Candidatus Baltobacteraceae bacterium]
MFARLAKMVVIVTLVATTVAHWALLQSVAWTTMLAENLSCGSVSQAVSRTFDGKHPCPLCKAIAAGKKSESKKDHTLLLQRFEFPLASGNPVLTAPPQFEAPPPAIVFPKVRIQRPPVPPPRRLLG